MRNSPYYSSVPTHSQEKTPVPAQKKPRKPQFFPLQKTMMSAQKCRKTDKNLSLACPKVPFSISCGTHNRGGGVCKSKFFQTSKCIFSLSNTTRDRGGGGRGGISFIPPLKTYFFPSPTVLTSAKTTKTSHAYQNYTFQKKLFPFSSKKPQILPFFGKKNPVVKKTPLFAEKTPKPKSFLKNPRSCEKAPTLGTLYYSNIAITRSDHTTSFEK